MVALSSAGLRVRLFFLVALSLLPALALIVYSSLLVRETSLLEAKSQTLAFVRRIATENDDLIAYSRELLAGLSRLPAVQEFASPTECGHLLAGMKKTGSRFANLGVADLGGKVVCSAIPFVGDVNIADRAYFQRALASRSFAIGNYQIGRITGKPAINFAYPIFDGERMLRIVFAAADLSWLERMVGHSSLPADLALAVVDNEGSVLAVFPREGGLVGKSWPPFPKVRASVGTNKEGVVEAIDPDGKARLYAFARLVGGPSEDIYLIYGLPKATIYGPAVRQFWVGLAGLGIAALLVFAIVWLVGELLVLKSVKTLAAAARRLGQGELKARTGLSHAGGELGLLARSFDNMAEAIEAKEKQLVQANRALRVLSAGNRTLLRGTDERTLLDEMCQAIVGTGGYRLAWVGYVGDDEAKLVRPVAHAGTDEGYLDGADITWADKERGRGPVGTAVREGRPAVARHILTDPAFRPWREEAVKRGFASVIALPVRRRSQMLGVLGIFAAEPDAFNAEEAKLLEELADDLGYGIANRRDAEARERIERELEHQYSHDALTGLANRSLFEDRVRHAMLHAVRTGRLVAVLLMGMDRFKIINESLGHSVGDALLKHVGPRLAACLREDDTVARFSGDEFAVALIDVAKAEDVAPLAGKLLAAAMQPLALAEREIYTSASMGISLFPKDGESMERLLQNADAAMHSAKSLGGNAFRFYVPEMNERMSARFAMEADLHRALERNELLLHFQPKASLVTGEMTGAEALVRWRRPEIGLVPPGDFIPLAEETGLIQPIGEWVIETVCEHLRAWLDAGLPVPSVAINLSARQFRQENLVRVIRQALRVNKLDAGFIELEITESALMDDVLAAVAILRELKTIGVRLSLDDFGTGFSSLSYLKRFPIDQLKIDQSFVRDVTTDPDDAAICIAVIDLAHNLNLKVVAEGVETAEQMSYLRLQGCDEMQGYYFSRPLSAEEFVQILAERKTLALPETTGTAS